MLINLDDNRALVIGVGADLPCTVQDANGIGKYLTDPQRCGFKPSNVAVLTEAKAHAKAVLAALDDLAKEAVPESTVIVYFSGHGYTRQDENTGDTGYWLMPFGYDLNKLKDSAISGRVFSQKLAAIQAKRLLLVLDCCHAGGITETKTKTPGASFAKSAMPQEIIAEFRKGTGRFLLASCKDDEKSLTGEPYSLFTRALVAALCGAGAAKQDGFVRVFDLFGHTRQMVPQWAEKMKHVQTPVADVEEESPTNNFVVAHYAKANFDKGVKTPLPPDLPELDLKKTKKLNRRARRNTATLTGDGAIALGDGAQAAGKGAVIVNGNNSGDINTGSITNNRRTNTRIDARRSQGFIYDNQGEVNQHFGDRINTDDKPQ
jgi:hypothetical protein